MAERWIARMLFAPALLVLVVVAASDLVTDRFAPAQSFWWMPRLPIDAGVVLWCLLASWYVRRRLHDGVAAKRLLCWAGAAAILALVHFAAMWGIPSARPNEAIRLVHWNASYLAEELAANAVAQLLAFDADALILTDAGPSLMAHAHAPFRAAGYSIAAPGRFTVFSRVALIEARPLLADRGRSLARLQLSTPQGALVIDAVDLPSATTIPRAQAMRSFIADLASIRTTQPDLLIGDFNITRGSHSLSLLAPDAVEAFAEAGSGWGGSYPRDKPFWGIDLTLVRPPWKPVRSEIVDLGFGRHRVQVVDVKRDASAGAEANAR